MKYTEATACLIEKIPELKSDIFNLEDSPDERIFTENYNFFIKVLEDRRFFDIKNIFIYFSNQYSFNARAKKIGSISLIAINLSIMVKLKAYFYDNKDLDSILLTNYNSENIENLLSNNFIYWTVAKFTFYHEYAHIIQNSTYLINSLEENITQHTPYSKERHILELDADIFAAYFISAHLISDFCFSNKKLVKTELKNIITVISASIYVYVSSFKSLKSELYFEEYNHPHPLIRSIIIVKSIIEYFTLYCKDCDFRDLYVSSIELAKELNLELNPSRPFMFGDDYKERLHAIVKYSNQLIKGMENSKYSAVKKRAKIARKIKTK